MTFKFICKSEWSYLFLDSIGVIFGFLSNQQISEGITRFKTRVVEASDDSVNYITDTVDVSQTVPQSM